jgi:hypothetical protein
VAERSTIAEKLQECLDLVNTEDRLEVRALQDRIAELEADRRRFGDLVAETGRQIRPLSWRQDQHPARTELQELARRLTERAALYADGREWSPRNG